MIYATQHTFPKTKKTTTPTSKIRLLKKLAKFIEWNTCWPLLRVWVFFFHLNLFSFHLYTHWANIIHSKLTRILIFFPSPVTMFFCCSLSPRSIWLFCQINTILSIFCCCFSSWFFGGNTLKIRSINVLPFFNIITGHK